MRIEMKPYIEALAARLIQDPLVLDTELDEALAELDCEMQRLSAELEVEHVGPGVGMRDMGAEQVYRLVVRRHRWDVFSEAWGLKVCDASSNCDFRPMWPIQGTGRLRKRQVVQVLPELFLGYAEAVARAGKTILNMRWFEVSEVRGAINENKVQQWQVTLKIGFTLDDK